jgi:DNA-binding FadR family transcriptional regulator
MTFGSIKRPSLSVEVADEIKKAIASKQYQCGDKLPSERELCEQFEVSRVTVRDALNTLHVNGLINIRKGRNAGAYVIKPTADPIIENFQNLIRYGIVDYSHLLDARLYIEPLAAKVVAQMHTFEEIQSLEALLDDAERHLSLSWKRARLINVSFHSELAKITKNPIIVYITESVTQAFSFAIIEDTESLLDRNTISSFINEHRTILEKIKNKKDQDAYDLSRIHLIDTFKVYSHYLPYSVDTFIASQIENR